jgi:hypothetical protein
MRSSEDGGEHIRTLLPRLLEGYVEAVLGVQDDLAGERTVLGAEARDALSE